MNEFDKLWNTANITNPQNPHTFIYVCFKDKLIRFKKYLLNGNESKFGYIDENRENEILLVNPIVFLKCEDSMYSSVSPYKLVDELEKQNIPKLLRNIDFIYDEKENKYKYEFNYNFETHIITIIS